MNSFATVSLSNGILCTHVAQETTKLPNVNVGVLNGLAQLLYLGIAYTQSTAEMGQILDLVDTTISVTKADKESINAFHRQQLRRVLNISFPAVIKNKKLVVW